MLSQRYLFCFYGFIEAVNLSAVIRTSGTKEKGDGKSILNGYSTNVLGGKQGNLAMSCA